VAAEGRGAWLRPFLVLSGGLIFVGVGTAAVRVPVQDITVWFEAVVVAGSTLVMVALSWWLAGRPGVRDGRVVLAWGLGSGAFLGALWIAEIAFNNVTPHSVSTAAARGVLDDLTWAIVGVVTAVAAGRVTAVTGRWRSGIRTGAWSGVGSGLGAGVGGALLVGFLRPLVERDPLMVAEWRERSSTLDLSVYVTRETLAGVGGHIWVLGLVQGVLLGALAAAVVTGSGAVRRHRPGGPARSP
jgi:hypothetical protein